MHKYQPQTKENIKTMLDVIGAPNQDALFHMIPNSIREKLRFDLPKALDDIQLTKHMEMLSSKNQKLLIFRGGGAFDHYVPTAVRNITSRQEFLTSYTPYQPEVSQGTLQYIFEYQSIVCELTGMDVSNASMYDGSTATAEAMFMAYALTKKNIIYVSQTVDENILSVIETYAKFRGIHVVMIQETQGVTDLSDLNQKTDETMGIVIQSPNKYGNLEPTHEIQSYIHARQGLFILNREAGALPLFKSPSDEGADIVCGDMQAFGLSLQAGGPYIGYLATKKQFVRKMPGRICGITHDVDGKLGFVLTLQAREQHIRRDKANSNICSNQSLNALAVTVYVSLLGKQGLVGVSQTCLDRATYLKDQLIDTGLFEDTFKQSHFKEFTLRYKKDAQKLQTHLIHKGILGPVIRDQLCTFAVTEKRSKEEIDAFVEAVLSC
jgi:glycine dehydrogenase subunit 1